MAGVGECLQESQQSNKCLTTALSYILAILTSEVRGHVTSHPVCGRDRDGECGGVPVWVCECESDTPTPGTGYSVRMQPLYALPAHN